MEIPEKLIYIVRNVPIGSRFFYPTNYDFYLTDKRLIAVQKGLRGPYQQVSTSIEKKNESNYEELDQLALDDLLKGNAKNFALPYENIEKLRFYSLGLGSFGYYLDIITKETKKTACFNARHSAPANIKGYNQLREAFSNIDVLKEKIEK